jgi:hypothetical protein
MAVLWLRRLVACLSPRMPGITPVSVHVGFVVDEVALGQVFLWVVGLHSDISLWGMNKRAIGSCSLETLPRPIDMNNNHYLLLPA